MKDNERDRIVEQVVDDIKSIFNTKGKDYAGSEDILANFKEEAERLGLSPSQVLMIYKNKHERSINSAVKRDPDRPHRLGEPLRESLIDAIVYNILMMCLLEDSRNKKEPGHEIKR